MGWIIAALYLVTAIASAMAARRGGAPSAQTRTREQMFWWFSAVVMGFLAMNKQLDLQSLLTSVARCVAVDQGWYEERRAVQRWFVLGVLSGGAATILALGWLLRHTFARTGLALVGLGFVSLFVVIRAASIHRMDSLIEGQILGLRVNWLLELPGPFVVLVAASSAIRHRNP